MILSPENQEADLSLSLNLSLKMLFEGLYSATCVFTSLTSQCKMTCFLIFVFWNPAYFTAVAFLLQEHAGLSAVLAHDSFAGTEIRSLFCHQFLLSSCRDFM